VGALAQDLLRLLAMPFRISVDTGGTFTDVVVADPAGRHTIGKALTTPERIFRGMRAAIEAAAEELGLPAATLLRETDALIYGTTRATNAVVTKSTAKTAFLTTTGFADTLVLREGGKFNPNDYSLDYPDPYIPRRYTFEIDERVMSDGTVLKAIDRAQAGEVAQVLKSRGFEAVAISLLWSIANPAHELALAEILDTALPGVPYTLSHRLIPIVREYRRASATAIDASLKPLMQRHLAEMESDLRDAGYRGDILVSTSVGGCMHVDALVERPIHTLKSGPAMAPVAGRVYSAVEDLGGDVIVCDTGGTTFDVGLVRDGALVYTRDSWLGRQWIGHMLSMSTVDVRSVGAGGGSIAWLDAGGLLRVGPRSAGSVPGPACYARGGTQPTVTDAALVLGYIDPDYFVGGRMALDKAAAEQVVGALAERLGLAPASAAHAVMRVADELMIKAIHEITVNEGLDPAESTLVAGGGAAGLNILPIAQELGCRTVVLPKTAAALSACGMQFSDIVAEQTGSRFTSSANFDRDGVNAALEGIEAELQRFRATLQDAPPERCRIDLFVEARYKSQVWELDTKLPCHRFRSAADVAALVEAFHQVHERVYAVRDAGSPVECVNWKGRLTVGLGAKPPATSGVARSRAAAARGTRKAYFGDGWVDAPVYRGEAMAPGDTLAGPAIIEEPTTTVVVYPGCTARVSAAGNFILGFA
jgi:N-methylhydantoinase A